MTPNPSPPPGLLGRWLTHPGPIDARVLRRLMHFLAKDAHVSVLTVAVTAGLGLAVLAVCAVVNVRQPQGGCWVAIAPPSEPDPAGSEAFWRMLAPLLATSGGLVRSRLPVSFECHGDASGLRIGLWVPPRLPLAGVLRAIESAWPGSGAIPSAPPESPSGRTIACRARPGTRDWLPLGGDTHAGADPIRAVLGSLQTSEPGNSTRFLVLVRPARRRQVGRARRAARSLRRGQPTTTWARSVGRLHQGST